MAKFNFEKNLDHQSQAVKSTVGVFDGVEIIEAQGTKKQFSNPIFDTQVNFKYVNNIGGLQEQNSIERNVKESSGRKISNTEEKIIEKRKKK